MNIFTKDAYASPRVIRPGCEHKLGCRCDPPYHLRESTPVEKAREAHNLIPFTPPSAQIGAPSTGRLTDEIQVERSTPEPTP